MANSGKKTPFYKFLQLLKEIVLIITNFIYIQGRRERWGRKFFPSKIGKHKTFICEEHARFSLFIAQDINDKKQVDNFFLNLSF